MVLFRGTYWLSSTYFILLRGVSSAILERKQWSCSQVPKWNSRGELLQLYLMVNVTGLVQFGRNLSCILPPVASQNYLLQSISVNQYINFYISFMVICSLEALKKSSKIKETRIKKEIVEVLQQDSYRRNRSG